MNDLLYVHNVLTAHGFYMNKVTQLVPQLAHVTSCEWKRGDGESMWGYLSITHNFPRGQVVARVVPLYAALA